MSVTRLAERSMRQLNLETSKAVNLQTLPQPQMTYLFKDFYKEIMRRNTKKVGSLGSR